MSCFVKQTKVMSFLIILVTSLDLFIGIPVKSSTLDGLDALLSTVQMPSGIPVATVAIDGAQNAALLAAQMLAIYDGELAARLDELRREMEAATLEKDRALREKLEKERN